MIEQSSNVVYKERVQLLGDLLLVCKLQSPLERNPEPHISIAFRLVIRAHHVPHAFEMHRPDLDHMPRLFALEYAVSAASSHTSYIEQFCAVDHVIICWAHQLLITVMRTGKDDLHDERRRRPWLLLGSRDYPRPPTE